MSLFSQCFWDSNLATSNGFEILVEHINKDFEILSTIINLLEHKVSSDDLYGRAQSKIAKSYMKPEKSVKNDEIIKKFADRIEKEANERILQCDKIKTEIIDRLKDFMKSSLDKFKKAKSECSKSNKERKAALDHAQKCVKSLNSKIKAHETFARKLGQSEDERNKAKITKSLSGVKISEKEMSTAIHNLNSSIDSWKSHLLSFCSIAEEVDLAHNINVKECLSRVSNILMDFSSTYKIIQAEYGDLSNELNPQAILEQFAKEKQTKEALPAGAFTYQKTEAGVIEYILDYASDSSGVLAHVPFVSTTDGSAPYQHSSSVKSANKDRHNTFDSDEISSQPIQPPPLPATVTPSLSGYVIAQYDYTAQADDELTFAYGDKIKIIFKEDESWYMGEMVNGTRGIFPITYVNPE